MARKELVRGLLWTNIGQLAVQVMTAASFFALVYFLTPFELGLYAMAEAVIGVIGVVRGFGINQALVFKRSSNGSVEQSAFWFLLAAGLCFTILTIVIAPLASSFLSAGGLLPVLQVLSFTYVLFAIRLVPQALTQRSMLFKERQKAIIGAQMLYSVLVVLLAWRGYGVWSIVIAAIIKEGSLGLAFLKIAGFRPALHFQWGDIRELMGFGGFALANEAALILYYACDRLVIGNTLDIAQAGYYQVAAKIGYLASIHVGALVYEVIFPYYAKIKENIEDLAETFQNANRAVAYVNYPVTGFVIVIGPAFLAAFYGTKWAGAAFATAIMAVAGFFRMAAHASGTLFYGLGKPRIDFYFKASSLLFLVPFIYVMARSHGLAGAVLGIAVNQALFTVIMVMVAASMLGVRAMEVVKIQAHPVMGTVTAMAASYLFLSVTQIGKAAVIFLGFFFVAVYLAAVCLMDAHARRIVTGFIRSPLETFRRYA